MTGVGGSCRAARQLHGNAFALLIVLAAAVPTPAVSRDAAITIPATTLDAALTILARQAGVEIISIETGLRDRKSVV